ncbi:MAG TPA: hypothetical protein VJ972_03170, partial [Anaerolineales bacterium]|nr:hypothetical protein [Anaerolineales bacterium]
MRDRRIFAMIGIVVMAILLAFPLRDAVFRMIVIPLAYVIWVLGLVYRSVNQAIWWIVAMVLVLAVISRSLMPRLKVVERVRLKAKPVVGQVESLAGWIKKTERGVYFKWLIANRLGKIANQILANRSTGKQRSFFDPLTGPDWTPDHQVQSYLESGLHGSFADYPQKNRLFST